ncbi:tagaturonate reductase [Enterococcus sp. BWB1-3]|uniref:tagaturonate reductase n=1 Tax=Enterococcus sp. BWB1-3 TaxID=2787713 RepID=UPI0019241E03|nr:tagaturonate reductase [Enterococcus sp. BWB1-3]MBL1230207.1 tagaturonate reductase [Enterococcus sp. BWB1-3]
MEQLSAAILKKELPLPVKVIQFGEGNFMRAFVDWQLQQMNKQNLFNGRATIVQPIAQGLGAMLKEQDSLYTVILEGLMNGEIINEAEIISSVESVINPYEDWIKYLALAENDAAEFIISNTTEAGIQYNPNDTLDNGPQQSFPAKLTALLYRRFQLNKSGFTIIPCELIDRNGERLKEIVLTYAEEWQLGDDFIQWLETENTFCCSLVDRIVPGYPRDTAQELNEKHGYIDNLMVKAEPFLLWVIEGPEKLKETLPLEKAGLNVVVTNDMTPYRERKVHLLNGPHTAMVPLAMLAELDTVESVMKDSDFRTFIDNLFTDELIPVLSLPEEELIAYSEQIKERFLNPFANHQLSAISLNSISKFQARLLPVFLQYAKKKQMLPPYMTATLASLLLSYRGDKITPQDDTEVIAAIQTAWNTPETAVSTILSNKSLWGQDLTSVPELISQVEQDCTFIERQGTRALIQQLNKG